MDDDYDVDAADLVKAMNGGDVLAEAEIRYRIVVRAMTSPFAKGTEVKALSIEADRLIHKIVALRAERAADAKDEGEGKSAGVDDRLGKVVEFDVTRFRKSG